MASWWLLFLLYCFRYPIPFGINFRHSWRQLGGRNHTHSHSLNPLTFTGLFLAHGFLIINPRLRWRLFDTEEAQERGFFRFTLFRDFSKTWRWRGRARFRSRRDRAIWRKTSRAMRRRLERCGLDAILRICRWIGDAYYNSCDRIID